MPIRIFLYTTVPYFVRYCTVRFTLSYSRMLISAKIFSRHLSISIFFEECMIYFKIFYRMWIYPSAEYPTVTCLVHFTVIMFFKNTQIYLWIHNARTYWLLNGYIQFYVRLYCRNLMLICWGKIEIYSAFTFTIPLSFQYQMLTCDILEIADIKLSF